MKLRLPRLAMDWKSNASAHQLEFLQVKWKESNANIVDWHIFFAENIYMKELKQIPLETA